MKIGRIDPGIWLALYQDLLEEHNEVYELQCTATSLLRTSMTIVLVMPPSL